MKPHPEAAAQAFLGRRPAHEFFIPSVVVAEIRFGIMRRPVGRRRETIDACLNALLDAGFAGRIVTFDAASAARYATARVAREQGGRPVSALDAMIGGMALAVGAPLATSNIRDFDGYDLTLFDPSSPVAW
jgi:predicted nucleic acid-binding protein